MFRTTTENSPLLRSRPGSSSQTNTNNSPAGDRDAESLLLSNSNTKTQRAFLSFDSNTTTGGTTTPGDRLPFNDYTTIDWLHDLVIDHARAQTAAAAPTGGGSGSGIRHRILLWWDAAQGWVAAFMIGVLTAIVAFLVDITVAVLADWKEGHCSNSDGNVQWWWRWWGWLHDRRRCARHDDSGWTPWSTTTWSPAAYAIYVGVALVYGLIAGCVTMLTRSHLPTAYSNNNNNGNNKSLFTETTNGKMMYMAAGSGIPEIKTILSGFVIPHFLDFKVLVVKAVGATFAVPTGMCLGKEGPFVHISTCMGYLVAKRFPKYRQNGRKMREMLSVACSAGLSVAFGAPIGGVLFSYEVSSLCLRSLSLSLSLLNCPFRLCRCRGVWSHCTTRSKS